MTFGLNSVCADMGKLGALRVHHFGSCHVGRESRLKLLARLLWDRRRAGPAASVRRVHSGNREFRASALTPRRPLGLRWTRFSSVPVSLSPSLLPPPAVVNVNSRAPSCSIGRRTQAAGRPLPRSDHLFSTPPIYWSTVSRPCRSFNPLFRVSATTQCRASSVVLLLQLTRLPWHARRPRAERRAAALTLDAGIKHFRRSRRLGQSARSSKMERALRVGF
jgi:hypothetical protein